MLLILRSLGGKTILPKYRPLNISVATRVL